MIKPLNYKTVDYFNKESRPLKLSINTSDHFKEFRYKRSWVCSHQCVSGFHDVWLALIQRWRYVIFQLHSHRFLISKSIGFLFFFFRASQTASLLTTGLFYSIYCMLWHKWPFPIYNFYMNWLWMRRLVYEVYLTCLEGVSSAGAPQESEVKLDPFRHESVLKSALF